MVRVWIVGGLGVGDADGEAVGLADAVGEAAGVGDGDGVKDGSAERRPDGTGVGVLTGLGGWLGVATTDADGIGSGLVVGTGDVVTEPGVLPEGGVTLTQLTQRVKVAAKSSGRDIGFLRGSAWVQR
jgi:hypothetical protein